MDDRFWQELDQLVTAHPLKIDRPKGAAHPLYPNLVYPLDYGYPENTQAVDGGEIDVWIGSLPVTAFIKFFNLPKSYNSATMAP